MSESPKDDLDALREDFNKLREDVGKLTDTLKQLGLDRAHGAQEHLNERLDEARERLRERVDTAGQRGRAYYDQLEGRVGEHPFSSLLTAFGVGFVIAKLLDLGGRR
ncbi:MAG: hypothetical protein P8011_06495 [Acidihalobacter sp.]|jgi:ElaB/YqjD/DUF883 family membrane-anchored ribosome-binding protein|uniref:DUF883 family protein n=1 Tax=Acidihalobacter sp. TaxID=1872108 RepID=UPI00307D28EC